MADLVHWRELLELGCLRIENPSASADVPSILVTATGDVESVLVVVEDEHVLLEFELHLFKWNLFELLRSRIKLNDSLLVKTVNPKEVEVFDFLVLIGGLICNFLFV